MNTQGIRNEIVRKISEIPDIGKVQPFERYAKAPDALRDFYMKGKELCGWFVHRAAVREEALSAQKTKVWQDWKITGFMGLTDAAASEILFDAKIDAIRRAFRTSPLKSADDTGFVQVVSSQPVMFCGILCHAAELTMQTVSYADIEADPDFDLADWLTCKTDYEAGLTTEDLIELGGTDASED